MKRLKWAVCFAVAAALLWAGATASAKKQGATMLAVATDYEIGYDPKCGDPSEYFLLITYFEGTDGCGGRFSLIWSACVPWENWYEATQNTFETLYQEGGTLTGTMDDMELLQTGDRCVLVPVPPAEFHITGGTDEFANCTGKGDVVFYLNSGTCGGDSMQILSLDGKIKFPGNGECPNDSDEESD